ncbi:MAG: hypothetical protein AAGA23_15505 [Pseudomonadota bacterium]
MVLSHTHRFIFWKPHKVGSTSVMVALGSVCGVQDSVGGVADSDDPALTGLRRNMTAFCHLPTGGNHAAPVDLKMITDALWGEGLWQHYVKVTIVRNPWARAVSWWDYATHRLEQDLPFDQALTNTERPYWFDDQGKALAQVYLRCENLKQDYLKFCGDYDIPTTALPRLRRGQRTPDKPYWEYYNDETRQLIADNFRLEIDHFGYRFGDPA